MRAAVLHETGGPEVLRIEDVPMPHPGPAEILVQVAACGICGHDQADRSGLTPVKRPAILGHEISGIVTDVGDKVQAFKPGDRVACKQITTCGWCDACRGGREMQCRSRHFNYGGWAEFVVLSEQVLLKVPDEVDLIGASVVSCAVGSCLRALRQVAKLLPGERAVVTGAGGGLGIHGMQVAKALGAYTIALTSSPDKADDLRALGADAVVVADGRDYWQEILAATDGRGADVVLDNVGHPGVFGPCFRGLAQGGRYVFTGQVERQKVDLYPAFVFGKEAIITGSASTRLAEFVDSMELVRSGKVSPVVQAHPLHDIVQANRRLDERGFLGRGVLVP